MASQHGDALPDDFAARVVAHLLKSGRDDRLHMRYEAARAHFQEVLDLQPGHSTALLEWGRTYCPMEAPGPDQVGALERAARAAPDSLEVVAELELACRQPGREERGRELKQRVLALADRRLAANEADVEALYCKARLLRGAGDFAGALPLLQSLVKLAPQDQACLYEYGLCLSRLDRHAEAASVYESVLQAERTTFWAFCACRQLATHHAYRTGYMDEAIRHMEAARRLMPSPGEAGNLIYFHSGAGRPDRGWNCTRRTASTCTSRAFTPRLAWVICWPASRGRRRRPFARPWKGPQTTTSPRRSTSTWRVSRTRRTGPKGWTVNCAGASPWTWGGAASWRVLREAPSGAGGRGGSPSRFRRWAWTAAV